MDKNTVIKGLYDISGFIAGRIGFEQAKNFMHIIDEAVALLEECAVKVDKQAENLPNENRKIEKIEKSFDAKLRTRRKRL